MASVLSLQSGDKAVQLGKNSTMSSTGEVELTQIPRCSSLFKGMP